MLIFNFSLKIKSGIYRCRSPLRRWLPINAYELTRPPVKGMNSCKPIYLLGLVHLFGFAGGQSREWDNSLRVDIISKSPQRPWTQYNESILPKHYIFGMHYCSNFLSSENFNKDCKHLWKSWTFLWTTEWYCFDQ